MNFGTAYENRRPLIGPDTCARNKAVDARGAQETRKA